MHGILRTVDKPMLVFGLVGPVGSPLGNVSNYLQDTLGNEGYECITIVLSEFLMSLRPIRVTSEYERLNHLMDVGNFLRQESRFKDILAMHAIAEIGGYRTKSGNELSGKAFIIRQLKHPSEVMLLRQVYGDSFHLVGIHTPENVRKSCLVNIYNMRTEQADALIKRDSGEESDFGQNVTDTFHLSDLIVRAASWDDEGLNAARREVERYIELLFNKAIHTPTIDEYGMFFAYAASLRSADLSRQVGAAILTRNGELISTGANEVPCAGGGQYWEGFPNDDRDFRRGYDSNEVKRCECLGEVLDHVSNGEWSQLPEDEREASLMRLKNTRIMHLTEFGRAVHAEMEAILSAARLGVSVARRTLYTTTFPCHNCAKHIVGAGISRVVYIEPYAKSLADQLHGDAIAFSVDEETTEKVLFEPFTGVTPRRFPQLFSMVNQDGSRTRRKRFGGALDLSPGLRIASYPTSHAVRESLVVEAREWAMNEVMAELEEEGIG